MSILTLANYSLNMKLRHRQHWRIWAQCVCLFSRWTVLWGVHGRGSEWRNAAEDINREFGPHTHCTKNSGRNKGQDLIFPVLWTLKLNVLYNCATAEWVKMGVQDSPRIIIRTNGCGPSCQSTAQQRPSIYIKVVFNERTQTLKCKVCSTS